MKLFGTVSEIKITFGDEMGQGNWLCGFNFQFFPKDSPRGMCRYYVNLYTPPDPAPGILHNRPPWFLCIMTKERKI